MYCILIAGVPAAGKSTTAEYLSKSLGLPFFSKDRIKEQLYDDLGFRSREEKVKLGIAAMNILYQTAEQLMRCGQPFILENNFENISKEALAGLLEQYSCTPITIVLSGDLEKIYRRFVERESSPGRHPGHRVNDSYPQRDPNRPAVPVSYEDFVDGIVRRGMDRFAMNGPNLAVDTTDWQKVRLEDLADWVRDCRERILQAEG